MPALLDRRDSWQGATVEIQFLGHAAFLVTSNAGMRIVIDPFGNRRGGPRWFKRGMPPMRANLLAVTHGHFDHNAASALRGIPSILKQRSSIRVMDVSIRLVPDRHAGDDGPVNHLVVIQCGGVTLCHAGMNRAEPEPEALREVGRPDVLLAPVDDSELRLSFASVARLIALLDPRVVVPMHYAIPGLTLEASRLGGIERWLASLPSDVVVERKPSAVCVGRDDLPASPGREVWVMDAALA